MTLPRQNEIPPVCWSSVFLLQFAHLEIVSRSRLPLLYNLLIFQSENRASCCSQRTRGSFDKMISLIGTQIRSESSDPLILATVSSDEHLAACSCCRVRLTKMQHAITNWLYCVPDWVWKNELDVSLGLGLMDGPELKLAAAPPSPPVPPGLWVSVCREEWIFSAYSSWHIWYWIIN